MTKFFAFLILFSGNIVSSLAAQKGSASVIKVFSDKRHFTFQKTYEFKKNSLIAVHDIPLKRLFEAKVVECKTTTCLATLSDTKDSFSNISQNDYKVYYNFKSPRQSQTLSAHYGTPLGTGFRFSYRQEFRPKLLLGATYGLVKSADYTNVEMSAHLFSVYAAYNFLSIKKFDFKLLAEGGFALSELSFRDGSDSLDVKENTYVLDGSIEGVYNINPSFGLGFKVGASLNGLKSDYAWELGTFSNPYGKMLIFFEAGLYYRL